nr:60S ribosomal protein L32 [Paratrimastix eleionoma]
MKNYHKQHAKFCRHQSERIKRLGDAWRKPHGIDSRVRRQYKGAKRMVSIGYGTDAEHRFQAPNGKHLFHISNLRDVELMTMHTQDYMGEIAACIGARLRKDIVKRANELNLRLTNGTARLRRE